MWPKYLCSYKIKLLFRIAKKLFVRLSVTCSFIERMGSSLLCEADFTGKWLRTAASALENIRLPVRVVVPCAVLLFRL